MPKILVVEDYEPFRRYICTELESLAGFEVIQASDGLEAVSKSGELQPDLVLINVRLPKLGGLEAAIRIRRRAPRTRILFLSQETDSDVIRAAFRLGARGYVHKMRAQSDLLRAIEAIVRGGTFVSSGLEFSGDTHPAVAAHTSLDEMSARLMGLARLPDLLDGILDTGIEISGADFGNIQICDRETNELKMVAQRGFGSEFVKFFETVYCSGDYACGAAAKNRKQVVVEDVSTDPIFHDAEARTIVLNANVRACQSTPLFSGADDLFGVLNTHHRRPHRPSDSTLYLLDRFAQRAADAIKRLSGRV